MAKEIYRCEPCNYEYEHLYFDTVPRSMQKPVPPCPLCGKDLAQEEQEVVDDYFYRCWPSDGGCGADVSFEFPKGKAPNEIECPACGKTAKLGVRPGSFGIVHGNSTTKGASIDVAIGRDAERRWEKIHERKAIRDKFRKETGSQAISLTVGDGGQVYGKPISGKLQSVTVPKDSVNRGEK